MSMQMQCKDAVPSAAWSWCMSVLRYTSAGYIRPRWLSDQNPGATHGPCIAAGAKSPRQPITLAVASLNCVSTVSHLCLISIHIRASVSEPMQACKFTQLEWITLAGASLNCTSYQSILVPVSQNQCKHASSHKWDDNEYVNVHNTFKSRQFTFIIK